MNAPAGHGGEQKPFRFRDGESLPHAIRRIARHELERILEGLDEGPSTAEAIHEIRKGTKRLRTLVRLVRDVIGEKRYRRENRAFRDMGRAFSAARDAEVAEQSLEKVRAGVRHELRPRALEGPLRALRARTRAGHRAAKNRRLVGRVRASVRRELARIDQWARVPDRWAALR